MGSDRIQHWDGASLRELIRLLSVPALSARIEVWSNGAQQGEVQLVAGGVSEARAGDAPDSDNDDDNNDAALERLDSVSSPQFRIEPCLPNPETNLLVPPGPDDGILAGRPVVELMRYCESFVLTCALELWCGPHHASIAYRRGEIVKTVVNGNESGDMLPDVVGWTEGVYKIVLPKIVLPECAPDPSAANLQPVLIVESGGQVAMAVENERMSRDCVQPTIPLAPNAELTTRGTVHGMPLVVCGASSGDATAGPASSTPFVVRPAGATPPPEGSEVSRSTERSTVPGFSSAPIQPGQSEDSEGITTTFSKPTSTDSAGSDSSGRLPVKPSHPLVPVRRPGTEGISGKVRRRSIYELPIFFHVVLGLGLGLSIVATYWLVQHFGGFTPPH